MRGVPATVGSVPSRPVRHGHPAVFVAVLILVVAAPSLSTAQPTQAVRSAPQTQPRTTDEVKALRQKADQGDAAAQFHLGVMYGNGRGVPQDYAQAVTWLRKAADQGFAEAQVSLGLMYHSGWGVSKDDAQWWTWTRKAAEQGLAGALFNLSVMRENVYGVVQNVPQDYVEAYKWASLAAARSSGDWQKRSEAQRDRLAQKMTPAQIAEAQKRASKWMAAFEKRKK